MENKATVSCRKWDSVNILYKFMIATPGGEIVINDQRLNLLQAVDEYGTIRKAADSINISYRKAMYDLKEMHNLIGWPLIEKHSGGKTGGRAALTNDGKILLDAYAEFQLEFQEAVHEVIKKFKRTIKHH